MASRWQGRKQVPVRRVGRTGAIFNDAERDTGGRKEAFQGAEEEGSGLGGDAKSLSARIASGEFTSLSVTKVRFLKPVRKFLANVPGPGASSPRSHQLCPHSAHMYRVADCASLPAPCIHIYSHIIR